MIPLLYLLNNDVAILATCTIITFTGNVVPFFSLHNSLEPVYYWQNSSSSHAGFVSQRSHPVSGFQMSPFWHSFWIASPLLQVQKTGPQEAAGKVTPSVSSSHSTKVDGSTSSSSQ